MDTGNIINKRIREITKIELDEWIHKMIRKYDMTKVMYYNVSLIIRQMLDYAEELEIVEENLFRKVKIDSKRMFRKVQKKKRSSSFGKSGTTSRTANGLCTDWLLWQ